MGEIIQSQANRNKDWIMKYWVYEHIFPNGKRYIGLTTKTNPKRRWRNGGLAYKGQFVFKAIQKYGWKNIKHLLYECDSEKEMKYLERYLIAYYNTTNHKNGYNITPGGDYNVNLRWCTTVYQYSLTGELLNRFNSIADAARFVSTSPSNIRKAVCGVQFYAKGFIWTTNNSGVNTSSIAQKKYSRHSQRSLNQAHPSWKWGEIEQYDLSGKLIKTHHSAKQAEIETGVPNSNIYKCCSGQRKTAGGFVWKNK